MEDKELTVTNESLLTVQAFLNLPKVKGYLENLLRERTGQFIASLVSLANLDSKLAKCAPRSIMMCGLKAASLNLPLDNSLGFAYAIPYGDIAQFQIGYRGFIQLAMRTGIYRSINVIDIREGELKTWDALTETLTLQMLNNEEVRQKTTVAGYAAMFELNNGFRKVIYRRKDDLIAHGKRFSKTFSKGPWQSDTDQMCKKTLVKELLSKWGPLSTEVMEGIKADQAVIQETEAGEVYEYLDNGSELKPSAYNIDPETLAELNSCFDILGYNQAARDMKLAACNGDTEKLANLRAELIKKVSALKPSPEEKTKKELF